MLRKISESCIRRMNSGENALFSNITFDLDDMFQTFKNFNTKFCSFSLIEVGDKISIQDNKLVIFKSGNLQPIQRWWYNTNRNSSIQQLEDYLEDYFKFLEMSALCVSTSKKGYNCIKSENGKGVLDLLVHTKALNKVIVSALYKLMKTYNNTISVKAKIEGLKNVIEGFNSQLSDSFFEE